MIELKDVSLKFGEKQIFKDFNMTVKEGEKVLLKAPSGSGKSSLIKMLLGFVKADGGVIEVDNFKVSKKHMSNIRGKISYVSQDVDLDEGKVQKVIEDIFNLKLNKHMKLEKEKLISEIRSFGLNEEILTKNTKDISGGERQRLGMSICFLLDRQIMFLDEVTSGLDSELKAKVVKKVMDSNKTALIISHDDIWIKQENIRIERW